MMDERTKAKHDYYLPNERDITLGEEEFYCRDGNSRVCRVRATQVYPYKETVIYGCVYTASGRHFRGDYGTEPFTGVMRGQLYDNAEDCHNMTHDLINDWEKLRELESQ